MKFGIRKLFLQNRNNSKILDNKGINRIFLEIWNIFYKTVNFIIVKGNVKGTVQTAARKIIFKFNNFFVFILIKVVCFYTQRKILKSDVGGIRSVCIAVL